MQCVVLVFPLGKGRPVENMEASCFVNNVWCVVLVLSCGVGGGGGGGDGRPVHLYTGDGCFGQWCM